MLMVLGLIKWDLETRNGPEFDLRSGWKWMKSGMRCGVMRREEGKLPEGRYKGMFTGDEKDEEDENVENEWDYWRVRLFDER